MGKPIRTHDIDLAAFLLAQGATLSDIDRSNPDRQIFLISGDGLAERLADYMSETATVNVTRFARSRRLLLERLRTGARA